MNILTFINHKKFRVLRIILGIIFSFIGVVFTCLQFYIWLTKAEYNLSYRAYKMPIVFPPEISEMETENAGYKILYNYLRATKGYDVLENESADSIVEKMFKLQLGRVEDSKYTFIRDTGFKMPFRSFMYSGTQVYYEINLSNDGEKELEEIEICNLSASGFYRIYSKGYDNDAGVLAAMSSQLSPPTLKLGNLKPAAKCKVGIWLIHDLTSPDSYFNHKPYLIYKNGTPKTINFRVLKFRKLSTIQLVIIITLINSIIFFIVLRHIIKKSKARHRIIVD